jgi:hypothetical protein
MYPHRKKSSGIISGEHRVCAQPSAQKNACQEVLKQYDPTMEVHRLAGTPHFAVDLPTGLTDTTIACTGRS